MGPRPTSDAPGAKPGLRLTGRQSNPATTTLTIDGQTIAAVPGESIAAAMTAAGIQKIHEDRLGKARGLLCGMGACFACRVSVDGGPPQRACLTPVAASMAVQTIRYQEPLRDAKVPPAESRRETIACDVLVVGAGPAGATAACELGERGRQVVVLDERSDAGGQYFKQKISAVTASGPDDRQYREGRELIDRLRQSTAQLITGATVWGAFRDASGRFEVGATTGAMAYRIRPAEIVVATGAYESVPPFPGWTLPGVMTTGAAQSLVRAYRVAPGRNVLIAGNGPLNLQLACELVRAGVNVVAIAESAPAPLPGRAIAAVSAFAASPALLTKGLGYLSTLRKFGVPVFYGHRIHRAEGQDSVNEAVIAQLDERGQSIGGTERRFPVDALCLGYRQQPSSEIPRALGCAQELLAPGIPAVVRDPLGRTSVRGVYSIGDGGTPGGAEVAMVEGRLLAVTLLGQEAGRRDVRRLYRHRRFQRSLWSLYGAPSPALPADDVTVCRCESVSTGTLRSLLREGVQDIASLKRQSRAGMGLCQGRYCQKSVRELLDEARPEEAREAMLFEARNPIKPVTIADVAAEQPEWRGYRATDLPEPPAEATAPQTPLDEADTLIIGAGVIGTASALYLGRAGADVLMVDRGLANSEASGGNAGSLHLQLLPFDFDQAGGDSPAARTLPLQKLGIDLWIELQMELEANFELKIGGGLMLADSEADLDVLRKKAALEKRFGVDTRVLSAAETRILLPQVAEHIAGAAYCAGEGKINPLTATTDLLGAALKTGLRLREQTTVCGIERSGGRYRVSTNRGVITCSRIVNAAGGWSAHVAALLGATLPVKSAPQQMLVTPAVNSKLPYLLSLARRHLTMKQTGNGNLLIGGGWPATYDKVNRRAVTLPDSIAGNLWVANRVMPAIGRLQLIRSWATTGVMIDGAPIIGELPGWPGFYNVVGANGYTMAPIMGKIVADLILTGRTPIDIGPFSVERFNGK